MYDAFHYLFSGRRLFSSVCVRKSVFYRKQWLAFRYNIICFLNLFNLFCLPCVAVQTEVVEMAQEKNSNVGNNTDESVSKRLVYLIYVILGVKAILG